MSDRKTGKQFDAEAGTVGLEQHCVSPTCKIDMRVEATLNGRFESDVIRWLIRPGDLLAS